MLCCLIAGCDIVATHTSPTEHAPSTQSAGGGGDDSTDDSATDSAGTEPGGTDDEPSSAGTSGGGDGTTAPIPHDVPEWATETGAEPADTTGDDATTGDPEDAGLGLMGCSGAECDGCLPWSLSWNHDPTAASYGVRWVEIHFDGEGVPVEWPSGFRVSADGKESTVHIPPVDGRIVVQAKGHMFAAPVSFEIKYLEVSPCFGDIGLGDCEDFEQLPLSQIPSVCVPDDGTTGGTGETTAGETDDAP